MLDKILNFIGRELQMTKVGKMDTETKVKPSPEARKLFNKMVDWGKDTTKLTLIESFELGVHIKKQNNQTQLNELIELQEENWITSASDGGWKLG